MTLKRSSSPKTNMSNLVEKTEVNRTPRAHYLLEREKIKNEIGDLEKIRLTLGLSQRRICMLLLVDPSAWTRWNKNEAPPHIYQALKWLLELRKVNPDITAPNNIESRVDLLHASTQAKIRELEDSLALLERSLALTSTVQPAPQPDFSKVMELLLSKSKKRVRTAKKSKAKAKVKTKVKVKPKVKAKLKLRKVKTKVKSKKSKGRARPVSLRRK